MIAVKESETFYSNFTAQNLDNVKFYRLPYIVKSEHVYEFHPMNNNKNSIYR